MITSIILIVLLTMIPFLELRASVPAGILGLTVSIPFTSLSVTLSPTPWPIVLLVAIIANWFLGIGLYYFMDFILRVLSIIPLIRKLKEKLIIKSQKKIHRYVKKYGVIGLALFIGIPLPGSGVYTGALGAYMIGMEKKHFIIASLIGVIIAGIAMTIISLFASHLLS
jgi:uncharacterized membrane protein